MVETQTYTIEGADDESDSVEIPENLVALMQEGPQTGASVVADVVLQAFAQQGHAQVHHAKGDVSEEMEAANEKLEDLFEERFGVSLSEAMGHQH
jgi:hypothetical protein